MIIEKQFLSKQLDIKTRKTTFDEVNSVYTVDLAVKEASRCLNCKNTPCVFACPINNEISSFINAIKEKDFIKARKVIEKKSVLSNICSIVCPHEKQCEGACTMGAKFEPVAIGKLERFVAEWYANNDTCSLEIKPLNKKIAVIGSGPASISVALTLSDLGYGVTVYEKTNVLGGVLTYGIPSFRLNKSTVDSIFSSLRAKNVEFRLNTTVGKDVTLKSLTEEYDAVFIGSGAGKDKSMRVENEDADGVLNANGLLFEINTASKDALTLLKEKFEDKRVLVVGGGNVAMDVSRSLIRLGAKVTIVYRRTIEEMPACKAELNDALTEGVEISYLVKPLRVITENGTVSAMQCLKTRLGDPDEKGRRSPVDIEGSEFVIPADYIVSSIGSNYDNTVIAGTEISLDKWGGIVTDENGKTSMEKVYAGGDAVLGPQTVVLAMKTGMASARAIDEYLKNE